MPPFGSPSTTSASAAAAKTDARRTATPLAGQRVLAVTPAAAYGGFNTSVHRVRALEALGADVEVVDTTLDGLPLLSRASQRVRHQLFLRGLALTLPDPARAGERVRAAASRGHWDVIWLEKALTIGPRVVRQLRRLCPRATVVGFSPDDMTLRHNQSQQFIEALRHYDCFVTTKSHAADRLRALGCRRVVVVGNGFDPDAFRPVALAPGDVERLGGDVGFIGSFERERADLLLGLAHAGLSVRVWGDGWRAETRRHAGLRLEYRPLYHDDYARACCAFKINLGFLRKLNRDQQTTRSVEIPACRGFMLAERTPEHLALFEEGAEAEFFASPAELLGKCRHYLEHEAARLAIARRGQERAAAYSNAARLGDAFAAIHAGGS